jgi:uncharacterized OB-fold protein
MSGRDEGAGFGVAPAITAENRRFWQAAGEGRLVVEHCTGCNRHLFPPRGYCPGCGGRDLAEAAVTGPGVVYSFTVNWNPWQPGMDVPFVLALVEFPDTPGVRVLGRMHGVDVDAVTIGQAVTVAMVDGPGGTPVPGFRPADAAAPPP